MLPCREVVELVGTDRLASATIRERIGVRLHLLMCRHCRAYVRSLRRIAETARRLAAAVSPAADGEQTEHLLAAVRRAAAEQVPANE
jgi:NMD protein affecting ribosome stability and mRNA decay